MKTYLQTKQRSHVELNTSIYAHFILVLTTLLLVTTVPLFKQPTALHDLATLKTHKSNIAPVIISIYPKGEYRLNTAMEAEQSFSLATMKERLKKQFNVIDPKQTSICIKSNSTVTYGQIMEVIEYLQSLGAQHIGLILN
jgi:biopolymer transport protein ExbD